MKRIDKMSPKEIKDAYESANLNKDSCKGCIKYEDPKYKDTLCCLEGNCEQNIADYLNEEIESKLKPCPFCGERGYYVDTKEESVYKQSDPEFEKLFIKTTMYKIQCSGCSCQTAWSYYKEDAIDAWNRRFQNVV